MVYLAFVTMGFRKIFGILLAVFCFSISGSKALACKESLAFKKKFFYNVDLVEKYTIEHTKLIKHRIGEDEFLHSLEFISRYTKVSFGLVMNYQVGYPSQKTFEIEKRRWLDWYSRNKYKGLK